MKIMKILGLIFFTLLTLASTKAQILDEGDLLGEWHLKTMSIPNIMYVDFKKDSIAMIQDLRGPKELANKLQRLLIGELNEETAKVNGVISFYPGHRYRLNIGPEQDTIGYRLLYRNLGTCLIQEGQNDTIALSLVEGDLHYVQKVNGFDVTQTFETAAALQKREALQPIPQTLLLGTWKPLSITVIGCSYNFATGEVSLPDNIIQRAKNDGEDLIKLKAKLGDALRSGGYSGVKITFRHNYVIDWEKDGTIDTAHYTIVQKNGFTCLKRPNGKEIRVDFKDGHFKILNKNPKDGTDTEVVFEKVK